MSKVGIEKGPDLYLRPVEHPMSVRPCLRLMQKTKNNPPSFPQTHLLLFMRWDLTSRAFLLQDLHARK